MSIEDVLAGLSILELPVALETYEGSSTEYITYNLAYEKEGSHSDNKPKTEKSYWQIHLVTPREFDYREVKKKIKKYLYDNGFKGIEVTPITEKDTRHIVFECEITLRMEE